MTSDRIGIVLLAAGGSTRMGRPKQLLRIGGRTLIRRATETALCVGGPVVVVTGAEAEQVAAEVDDLPVRIIENKDWSRGMGSSLRRGVQTLTESHPDLEALIVTLCDQVDVTPDTLNRLRAAYRETQKGLCGASFDETIGPPALFSRTYVAELLRLPDASGAKSVLLSRPDDLLPVPCPEAAKDLDTWEEYRRLLGQTDKDA
ncbi:MAG TPA: nucleotidyltransferase family protein [Tepidisphaeraceae bacterium]|jgi:molybdenum cofactor cytidylyltransferase